MAPKGGLGKGLEALIPGGQQAPQQGIGKMVSIHAILANPRQPRLEMNLNELQDLADSIKELGILQPLLVSENPGGQGYTLIAGERRLRAAKLAGLTTVPVVIRHSTDQEKLVLALIENIQRTNLNPLETAKAYQELSDTFQLSHEEIAARVGKNRTTVSNALRLLKLSKAVQLALTEGQISEGHARAILGLESEQAQNACLQSVISQNLNVRQTEQLVQKLLGSARISSKRKKDLSPELQEIESQISESLGTRVQLRPSKRGGSVTIFYYSDEELDNLYRKLS